MNRAMPATMMSVFLLASLTACSTGRTQSAPELAPVDAAALTAHVEVVLSGSPAVGDVVTREDTEWREQLSAEQYRILRQSGTERAYTGALWDHHGVGTYHCAGCDAPLFSSATKFESGTGWPSFYEPIQDGRIAEHDDLAYGTVRTEIVCARCGGHLGHVFSDGPPPTGQRYCINSASLDFQAVE